MTNEPDRSEYIGYRMAVAAWHESRRMRASIYYLNAITKKKEEARDATDDQ